MAVAAMKVTQIIRERRADSPYYTFEVRARERERERRPIVSPDHPLMSEAWTKDLPSKDLAGHGEPARASREDDRLAPPVLDPRHLVGGRDELRQEPRPRTGRQAARRRRLPAPYVYKHGACQARRDTGGEQRPRQTQAPETHPPRRDRADTVPATVDPLFPARLKCNRLSRALVCRTSSLFGEILHAARSTG